MGGSLRGIGVVAAGKTTLISVDELIAHAHDADWRVVDCRHDLTNAEFGRAAYADGHIPEAVFMHLDEDLSGPVTGANGRHPLPDPDALAARLGALGITRAAQVVAYDDAGGIFAARLWWLLRWLGHDRVAVLNGGYQAWCNDAQPLTREPSRHSPSCFTPALNPGVAVDASFVSRHLGSPEVILIDARSPDRYRGENEKLDPVGGHIPGARNRFFRDNLAHGIFKPPALLREEFITVIGTHSPTQVVHQCGSGVTACHNLLAMEHAGLSGSRLYAGSWSEWCADPGRPVTSGDTP